MNQNLKDLFKKLTPDTSTYTPPKDKKQTKNLLADMKAKVQTSQDNSCK